MDISKINFLSNSSTLKRINEGYSNDEKWRVDNIYLLRISPHRDLQKLKKQANLINKVHALDNHIPFVHDVGVVDEKAYMILDYINGENGETVLPTKSKVVQYKIGTEVGKTLKHMHSVQAPADYRIVGKKLGVSEWKDKYPVLEK
ncbi:phosphotransferase [Bacillus sp. FJAT-22090]|uniref:phosphotransferase n=1 Tax=Bacillus sp. FJAT-22090 TaxID=1581038 RepID=UPI001642CCF7|nr:phosphotransferase [Bacillus sp. FJAT-22090]